MGIYTGYKVYGPYLNKGRLRVVLVSIDDRKTVSYPKYLIEKELGRYLNSKETVHHKDSDPLNNKIENLEILERSVHASQDVKRVKDQKFRCPECGVDFFLKGKKLNDAVQNRNKGKAGPFCGRSCAGRYATSLQYKKSKPLEIKRIKTRTI